MKLLSQLEDLMKKGWEIRYGGNRTITQPEKMVFYAFLPSSQGVVIADDLDELIDKINSGPPTK